VRTWGERAGTAPDADFWPTLIELVVTRSVITPRRYW